MKNLILLLLIGIYFPVMAQRIDTVYKTSIYESYVSYETKTPLFVKYKLYNGGGNCSRIAMTFKYEFNSLTDYDYKHSDYYKGHLVPAEDFAYNCDLGKLTFSYYNVIPQCSKLNRGSWKTLEIRIREISKKDSLLIICGGFEFQKIKNLMVPEYCFKIFKNLRTNQVNCYLFENNKTTQYDLIDFNLLLTHLTYNEDVKQILRQLVILGKK